MRFFPSIPASIATGAVAVPLFLFGSQWITAALQDYPFLLVATWLVWACLAFCAPVCFSTLDVRYGIQKQRKTGRSLWKIWSFRGYWRTFIFPAWGRMGVVFVSSAASHFILQAVGVKL